MLKGGAPTAAATATSFLIVRGTAASREGLLVMWWHMMWLRWRWTSMIGWLSLVGIASTFMWMIEHRCCWHHTVVLLRWIVILLPDTLSLVGKVRIFLMCWEVSVDVDVNIYITRMMRHGFGLVRHIVIVHAVSRLRSLRSKSLILLIIFTISWI